MRLAGDPTERKLLYPLGFNYTNITPSAYYAMALRCYDANGLWSWQATDLPPGSGRIWACDLDGDGADEAVTAIFHDVDELIVQVRRHIPRRGA